MGKILQLLRWKKELILKDENDKPLLDDNGNVVKVWIRIIGDESLQSAYKLARIKSAKRREVLRNPSSVEYQDEVLPILDADEETCKQLIELSVENNFIAEANSNVVREDLPKLEEVATDPDAPTLEEQEKLDKLILEQDQAYVKSLDEYVTTRKAELKAELDALTIEDLRARAVLETGNSLALATFLIEVQNQKISRSVFEDKDCKIPVFENPDDFAEIPAFLKKQIVDTYNALEMNPDDVKN